MQNFVFQNGTVSDNQSDVCIKLDIYLIALKEIKTNHSDSKTLVSNLASSSSRISFLK